MGDFQLQLLFKIIGLGSASGLLYQDNTIIAIGDNSTFLYEYKIDSKELKRHPLVENPQENIAKKDKKDFEAIAQDKDAIYIFGSGSTQNRNQMVQLNARTKSIISQNDVSLLYQSMQSYAKIKPDDFNIEGVIKTQDNWLIFNRGNGKNGANAIFTVSGKNLIDEFSIICNNYKLPKIKGVKTSFTDAVLVDNKIYFLATAEDTDSTYKDGEILGSSIGRIDLDTMKIDYVFQISAKNKFEGIAVYEKTDQEISFLLCEDNDSEVLESTIYKLTLKKTK